MLFSRLLPSLASFRPSALYSASVPSGNVRLRFSRSSWIMPPRSIPSLAFASNIRIAASRSRGPSSSSWAIPTSVSIMSRIVHSLTLNARPISPGMKKDAKSASPPSTISCCSVFCRLVFTVQFPVAVCTQYIALLYLLLNTFSGVGICFILLITSPSTTPAVFWVFVRHYFLFGLPLFFFGRMDSANFFTRSLMTSLLNVP